MTPQLSYVKQMTASFSVKKGRVLTRGMPWGRGKCRHRGPRPRPVCCFLRTLLSCCVPCDEGLKRRVRRVSIAAQRLRGDARKLYELLERVDKLFWQIICLNCRVKGSAGRLRAVAAQIEAAGLLSENSWLCKWSCRGCYKRCRCSVLQIKLQTECK